MSLEKCLVNLEPAENHTDRHLSILKNNTRLSSTISLDPFHLVFSALGLAATRRLMYHLPMQTTPIPQSLAPFFQEYRLSDLDPERAAPTIIERTLAYGNRDEVRWLLGYYGRVRVQHWLSEVGAWRLPRRRYRLWCVLLNVAETLRKPAPIWPY
jgi:hypothetical protein